MSIEIETDISQQIEAPVSPTIPHSREAEEAVVGAVLINSEIYYECSLFIKTSQSFYIHRNRWIWEAYENMFRNKMPVDLLTLSEYLDSKGLLRDVGGSAYLTSLINQVPSSLNAPSYASIVHAHYVRREMINAANSIANSAYDESKALDDVIALSTKALSDAVSEGTASQIRDISLGLSEAYDKIYERMNSGVLPGIPTGLTEYDILLGGGAQNGTLLMIAGRPGSGKTSLLLQIAINGARYTKTEKVYQGHIAIFSLEMSEEEVILRMLSQISGIDFQKLQAGKFEDAEIATFTNAVDFLSQLNIKIDDTNSVSPAYIRSRCEILNAEQKLDMVIVDSLNLMKSGLKFNRGDQEFDYNSYELKNLAKDLDIPFWLSNQMNRNIEHRAENAKPKLGDLREGGENAPHIVTFTYHEKDEIKGVITHSELITEKNRNGPTKSITTFFDGTKTKFQNAYVERLSL